MPEASIHILRKQNERHNKQQPLQHDPIGTASHAWQPQGPSLRHSNHPVLPPPYPHLISFHDDMPIVLQHRMRVTCNMHRIASMSILHQDAAGSVFCVFFIFFLFVIAWPWLKEIKTCVSTLIACQLLGQEPFFAGAAATELAASRDSGVRIQCGSSNEKVSCLGNQTSKTAPNKRPSSDEPECESDIMQVKRFELQAQQQPHNMLSCHADVSIRFNTVQCLVLPDLLPLSL